ncbi:MAG TPA: hypothetical protein IAD43_05900 [Candidatus Scatomorpha pullicola]|nr:hypothetical protein [Candidatus Scatomorpha pullicola]
MWFLEVDIAVRLLAATLLWSLGSFIARKYWSQAKFDCFLVILDLALIAYVSEWLAVFYLGYTLVTWVIVNAVDKFKRAKSFFFVLCCLVCAVPFFYIRLRDLMPELPLLFALTGIAYNMLKAIDAVYFVHYTGERVPLITYANYMLFFPVITAGPILRYRDFSASLNNPMPITGESVTRDFKRLILGYFKKVVVMSLVTTLLTRIAAASPRPWWSLAACLVSYFLFWLDMSGYADIAIAMGGFMGLKVPENFKKPLKAASMTQFWRNWHVSLTDWIREHIFVVLNGKRLTKYQGAFIGFGTMLVMGLWHGFTAHFVIEGLFNGVILAVENLCGITTVSRKASKPYLFFRRAIVVLLFSITTIFYTLDATQLANVLRGFITL